ncbi:hypothetical protein P4V33_09145 [Brevibacillus borstelensis]|uniref:hypothetical protein n=1 Tax=Brevibacillus borstelensis TaxID=45462 RepID=UPI002E218DE3|nr:hypothetical protein [Brevibacillus borstelensis]
MQIVGSTDLAANRQHREEQSLVNATVIADIYEAIVAMSGEIQGLDQRLSSLEEKVWIIETELLAMKGGESDGGQGVSG